MPPLIPALDYVLISDLARWAVVVVAFFTAFLVARMLYLRVVRGEGRAHPAAMLGTLGFLMFAAARRFERLGEPGDWWLWFAVATVATFAFGMFRTYRVNFRPPWLRRDRARGAGGHSKP